MKTREALGWGPSQGKMGLGFSSGAVTGFLCSSFDDDDIVGGEGYLSGGTKGFYDSSAVGYANANAHGFAIDNTNEYARENGNATGISPSMTLTDQKKNVVFTKDGVKVGVKQLSEEDYAARQQRYATLVFTVYSAVTKYWRS